MTKEEIKSLFNPKTIALIGASDNRDKVGGILAVKLLSFKGKTIFVNPNHSELFGLKCYNSISRSNDKIDLALIAIPRDFVAESLEECGKKKIKNVIIISAGFGEVGNNIDEKRLVEIAKKYDMRFLGPNCFGLFSPSCVLDCTFSATTPKSGNIAFISQSGALWSYIADYSSGKFGFSSFVSLGNMADLEFSDFIEFFSNDKETKSIVLYVEKLREGKRFIEACKRSKKKIYVVKAGKSEQASKAAFSHTGSLATDYRIYQGAFSQAGITLCSSLIEAFEKATLKSLIKKSGQKINLDKNAMIITNAGGAGALVTDYLNERCINVIGPLDILGTAKSEDYKKALESNKEKSNSFVVIATPQTMTDMENIARVIVEFKKNSGKNVIAVLAGDKSVSGAVEILKKNKINVFNTLEALS